MAAVAALVGLVLRFGQSPSEIHGLSYLVIVLTLPRVPRDLYELAQVF